MSLWQQLWEHEYRLGYLRAGGIRTRVLTAGRGVPVVLLHGTGGHLEAFIRNIGPLSEQFLIVVPDLVGHGFTDKPADYPHNWSGLSQHLLDLCGELGVRRPYLVGEGVGAQVAQWLAHTAPDKLSGIVLCSTVIVPREPGGERADALAAAQAEFQALTKRALEDPSPDVMYARMEWLFHPDNPVPQELVDLRTAIWADPAFRRCQASLLSSYTDPDNIRQHPVSWEHLNSLAVPTTVIWGEANRLMPLSAAEAFAQAAPGAALHTFPDAGLWAQYEQADRFNDIVRAFVETAESTVADGT